MKINLADKVQVILTVSIYVAILGRENDLDVYNK